MADYRVNLRSSLRLIESAKSLQIANRQQILNKELRKRINEKVRSKLSKVVSDEQKIKSEPQKKTLSSEALPYSSQVTKKQLEDEIFRIWRRRKKRGRGFLLIPDEAPIQENNNKFIGLSYFDGFENSSYANLGALSSESLIGAYIGAYMIPAFDFIGNQPNTGKLVANQIRTFNALEQVLNPNYLAGYPTTTEELKTQSITEGVFYHVSDSALPDKKVFPALTAVFNHIPTAPYENNLYETCTYEFILMLGSTPASVYAKRNSNEVSHFSTLHKPFSGYTDYYYDYDGQPIGPVYITNGVPTVWYEFNEAGNTTSSNLESNQELKKFVSNTLIRVGHLEISASYNSAGYFEYENSNQNTPVKTGLWLLEFFDTKGNFQGRRYLPGNSEQHIAIVYVNTDFSVYVNGTRLQTTSGSVPITDRNVSFSLLSVFSSSYCLETIVFPVNIPIIASSLSISYVEYQPNTPYMLTRVTNSTVGYVTSYFGGYRQVFTQEMQTGFHSLRFTPEQALYSGSSFTPPTRITELA